MAKQQAVRATKWGKLLPLIVVVAAIGAYCNSFSGAFVLDDDYIQNSQRIRQLWPLDQLFAGTIRPIVELSLALNYKMGGLDVRGYHAINLMVHILAALTLFGIVRRTLCTERLRDTYGAMSPWLALAVSLIWAVHPLQTGSVTYLSQRAESLMGLFYLLTLYCMIRGVDSVKSRLWWYIAAVLSCALGVGTKFVILTAPIVILLYDRAFLSSSYDQILRQRWGLYAGLFATWGMLAVLLPNLPAAPTAGFGYKGVTPLEYALTQPGVILYYLKLSVWPHPLCLDYGWPVAVTAAAIILPAILVVGLVLATVWALWRHPALGFVGAWFFLILGFTSSFIPIADLAFEHRMYLSLASVIVLVVIGGWRGLTVVCRRFGWRGEMNLRLQAILLVAVTLTFGYLTFLRNGDYHNAISLWRDTVAKRPNNPRAHTALADALFAKGKFDEAAVKYQDALRLSPNFGSARKNLFAGAHSNLGNALSAQGKLQEAIVHYSEALRMNPKLAKTHYNWGIALGRLGKNDEAITHYLEELRINPTYADAHNNLGLALVKSGKPQDAITHYQEALRLKPNFPDAHVNWGLALSGQGKITEAIARYHEALRISPNFSPAHNNLGIALVRQGKVDEAVTHYVEALRIRPDNALAHNNLGYALSLQGKLDEAITHYTQAVRLKPDYAAAHNNLGLALAKQDKWSEAASRYAEAVRLSPTFAEAYNNLGLALTHQGKLDEAIQYYSEAIRLKPGYPEAQKNLRDAVAKQKEG